MSEQVLAELAAQYADKRFHVFDVKFESGNLTGRVLDQTHLEALRGKLSGASLDSVRVLHKNPPVTRTVATSVTDLHKEPSFLAEMLTQILNGTTLEVLDEQDKWCLVRQTDGYIGWVYKGFLAETTAPAAPTQIVTAAMSLIYAEPQIAPAPASRLLIGTLIRVAETRGEFSRVEAAGGMIKPGWVRTADLRPTASFPRSADAIRKQMLSDARTLTGTYYLWGGNTSWGTDCSGLTQLSHRLNGITIPRDCDLQFAAGKPVEPPFSAGDCLYFFGGTAQRKVGHVGLATGHGWNMIHSSRTKNGVYEEDVQQNADLLKTFAGARSFL